VRAGGILMDPPEHALSIYQGETLPHNQDDLELT